MKEYVIEPKGIKQYGLSTEKSFIEIFRFRLRAENFVPVLAVSRKLYAVRNIQVKNGTIPLIIVSIDR